MLKNEARQTVTCRQYWWHRFRLYQTIFATTGIIFQAACLSEIRRLPEDHKTSSQLSSKLVSYLTSE